LNSPPLPFSFIPPSPIPGIVSTGIFLTIYIPVSTVFVPHSSSYTVSPSPPPSYWYQLPQAGPVSPSCSLILQKKENRNDNFAFLKYIHREFPCGTSMYIFLWPVWNQLGVTGERTKDRRQTCTKLGSGVLSAWMEMHNSLVRPF
jgi:hypothetical protein